jgi:FKBP-type peptidyl-prolyl cis-trans isomerase
MMGIRAWSLTSLAAVVLLSAGYAAKADGPATLPADITSAASALNSATTKGIGEGINALAALVPTSQPSTRPASTLLGSGVMITNTSAGAGAQSGDTVYVLYTGRLQATGLVFDSSQKHQPVQPMRFTLGPDSGVVMGFWEGIIGMQIGDKRTIDIPAALGYGEQGMAAAGIPSNAALEFDVELVGIARPSAVK